MKKRLAKASVFALLVIVLLVSVIFSNIEKNEVIDMPFFGTWRIEDVAVVSWTYEELEASTDPMEEDFIGYELEYTPTMFRLGEAEYQDISYKIKYETVSAWSHGGNFRKPTLLGYLREKEIELNGMRNWSGDTLLLGFEVKIYRDDVSYGQYDHIPVGTYCILLNEDTMIVGVWGKTLLAHKVK